MDDYLDLHHKLNDFIKCICSQQFILGLVSNLSKHFQSIDC